MGQVIKVQSQRNCPLHSKPPVNLYWFWVMQHLQTSVHCPPNCSLIFYSSLGIAGCFHYGLSHVRSTACVSKCHLRTPTTTFSFYFTSPLFCPWSSPLSPNILCARTTCISSMQKWKLRLWGCTLSLKCRTLRPEYQSLVFDACLLDFPQRLRLSRVSPSSLLSAFSFMQTGSNLYRSLPFTQRCT